MAKVNGLGVIGQNISDVGDEEKEEFLHFLKVVNAFKAYRKTTLTVLEECERNFSNLPVEHKKYVPNHVKTIDEAKVCIDCNMAVINEIIKNCNHMFKNKSYDKVELDVPHTAFDSEKVRSTLKQIARDWSVVGKRERELCYEPIIKAILTHKPLHNPKTDQLSVLVPGCGLGRLAWELARHGYYCQGNEFSFFMLFTSNFIINQTTRGESADDFHQFTIYPWVDKRNNNRSWHDVLQPVKFPDINPAMMQFENRFSMTAGDFLEIYHDDACWDCVATCFFIDTAHNIISYIERIYDMLKPGGLWVNLGPLLYHFSGMKNEPSIELSHEEVMSVVRQVGFQIEKEDWTKGLYTSNDRSMLTYEYKCAFFVAWKPEVAVKNGRKRNAT